MILTLVGGLLVYMYISDLPEGTKGRIQEKARKIRSKLNRSIFGEENTPSPKE